MADNTTQASWEAGDVIATDDLETLNGEVVSGVKMQRVKVCWGQDNLAYDTNAMNALPVQIFQQGGIKVTEAYEYPTYFAVLDRVVCGGGWRDERSSGWQRACVSEGGADPLSRVVRVSEESADREDRGERGHSDAEPGCGLEDGRYGRADAVADGSGDTDGPGS